MLIDKIKYKKNLADLWHIVFGDSYSYIDLIFKEEFNDSILCFGEIEDGMVVSAFYLLKNILKYDGKTYKGFYLYAAATLPEYRSRSIMSKLIAEAQLYCRNNSYDFITLVPSEESLYSYYSRFGFQEGMYRYKNASVLSVKTDNEYEIIKKEEDALSIRSKYENNIITFDKGAFSYAVACLEASGYSFYRISDDSYAVYSAKDKSVEEFISPVNTLDKNFELLCDFLQEENIEIASPYDISFCKSRIERYGMIYPINTELCKDRKYTYIYMNIALD